MEDRRSSESQDAADSRPAECGESAVPDERHDDVYRTTALEAVTRFATRQVELVAALVRDYQLFPSTSANVITADVVFELMALAQIREWERSGVLALLDGDFPSYNEAGQEFLGRLSAAIDQDPMGSVGRMLSERVLDVWRRQISFSELGGETADLLVHSNIDEGTLDALAEFVWSNREVLNQYINGVQES